MTSAANNKPKKFQIGTATLLLLLFASLLSILTQYASPPAAFAEALLESNFSEHANHDFVSYFGFSKTKTSHDPIGTTNHFFYSPNWTCSLVLTMNDKDGRIVHMKLGVPRPLVDDPKVTSRGRDIVKSFIMASAIGVDIAPLKELADEVYVRGLDLQPIQSPKSKNFADTGKAVPQLQAYKIGKGPLANGDNAIFLSQLPKLSNEASPLFQVIIGKSDSLGRMYKNCRLAFINENVGGTKKALPLLWCESWDEKFSQQLQKQSGSAIGKPAPKPSSKPAPKPAPKPATKK